MSVILARRSFHPRCCECGHGENVHPLRLSYACRRLGCMCMEFHPVQGKSLIAALDARLSKPTPRDWTWR